jgi:hypothetical protein
MIDGKGRFVAHDEGMKVLIGLEDVLQPVGIALMCDHVVVQDGHQDIGPNDIILPSHLDRLHRAAMLAS